MCILEQEKNHIKQNMFAKSLVHFYFLSPCFFFSPDRPHFKHQGCFNKLKKEFEWERKRKKGCMCECLAAENVEKCLEASTGIQHEAAVLSL